MIPALAALIVVLAFAMVRPRGLPEAVVAVPVAAALLFAGVVSPEDAWTEVTRLLPVVGFLAAVLVLAKLCDDEGLFRAAGAAMARHSAGRPHRLLLTVFAIAATTTAVLSLDATVLLLTPVILNTTRTLGISSRPHSYATAHLANTASLLLPVSNLTNLLAFGATGLSFAHFAGAMALPWLSAIAAEYLLLRLIFRRDLAVASDQQPAAPTVATPVYALVVLSLTLAGFAGTSLLGVSPAWAAVTGALTLAVRSLTREHDTVRGIVQAANIPFLVFVLCLGVVVTALMDHGLAEAMRTVVPTGTSLVALLGIATIAALLANLVNNLPAVLVMLALISGAGPAAVLAVLIGVNIGPNLSYPGSLSNLLWRTALHRAGLPAPFAEFSRVGLCTTPVSLVVAVLGLWVGVQLLGI